MEALFAAVDVTAIAVAVTALMLGFIGVDVLFLGKKYLKRVMGRS